jgi:hypothetical protein
VQSKKFLKSGILTLILVACFILCYELYWRSRGFAVSYNDGKQLWAVKRKQAYEPAADGTVIIGASRIKFDLDLDAWEKLTGDHPVQLSLVGTSPRPLLHDLANDIHFKGKLMIDVTEPLFFSRDTKRRGKRAMESIDFYKKGTPSERASSYIDFGLESIFVFLEEDKFALNQLLNEIRLPARKGVFVPPVFPKEFEETKFDRQTFMTPMFLADTSLQKRQRKNWTILGALDTTPGIKGDTLEAVFKDIKTDIDKIRSRGGEVMFVRTPSSGEYLRTEKLVYPREQYWDRLLAYTNTPGIHFSDYPAISNFVCPEWSHLTPKDGLIYTITLVGILRAKGWTFSKQPSIP